jgi:hypothetical protein
MAGFGSKKMVKGALHPASTDTSRTENGILQD